jgi:hypothetical protein
MHSSMGHLPGTTSRSATGRGTPRRAVYRAKRGGRDQVVGVGDGGRAVLLTRSGRV